MKARSRTAFAWLFLFLFSISSPVKAELPPAVAQAAAQADIPASSIALWIAPATGGEATARHNEAASFNPASLMKLLTTVAALDILGPAYQWRTEMYVDGERQADTLNGALILRGSGDPFLTWDKFGQWLRELRGRGITHIRGDLVIDRNAFAAEVATPNFDDDPSRAYNATPDALLLNFKALSLRLTPSPLLQGVEVSSLTPFSPLHIDNRLMSVAGACADWRRDMTTELQAHDAGYRLVLHGKVPATCGERILHVTAHDGSRFVGGVFRALWLELGGTWEGNVREGSVPTSAQLVSQWHSPPLSDIVRDINKYSNNVMSRQLFLSLGAQVLTPPTSRLHGELAIRLWLNAKGMSLPDLVLDNGSGLSRSERISARGLGQLLQYAWSSPRMPEVVASLPVAGLDGTGRRRFANHPVAGRAYLKSGSLKDVASIAGYVLDINNQWKSIVIIINHPNVGAADAVLQAAVDTAYH